MLEALPPPPAGRTGWPWTEAAPVPDASRRWPRLSVVTPSFNQGRYLEQAIRSVLLQNYPDLEYIVMDGGSSDESRAIIEKYRPWLAAAVSEADAGQADALNKGFSRATGTVHAYLNSDDFYAPGAFMAVAEHLPTPPARCLIAGACDIVDEAGQRLHTHRGSIGGFEDVADLWGVWYRDGYLPQPAVFWSGPAPLVTRFRTDLHYVMDYELWGRLLQAGSTVVAVPLTLAAFRTYPSQKSASHDAVTREVLPLLDAWLGTSMLPSRKRVLIAADLAYAMLRQRNIVGVARRRLALGAALVVRPQAWLSRQLFRDLRHSLRRAFRKIIGLDTTFQRIITGNAWGGGESVSGPGSALGQTETIRAALPPLLKELGCQVMLDAPCGDFHWLKEVALPVEYVGCDIVDELIARNKAAFASDHVRFFRADLTRDPLPSSDLILCRDCLVHLPDGLVVRALKNFVRSGSRYLLTTTFPEQSANARIVPGEWRPLNLRQPPFSLPAPLRIINENCTEGYGAYRDKSLALWDLAALRASGPDWLR
jgi:glycosyltransferase involved in cell wall biosynthesis